MSFVEERNNNRTNITRYYTFKKVNSSMTAVDWVSSLRNVSGLVTEYIYYSDLMNRSDEGSGNIQLDSQVTTEVMKLELKNRDVDLITLNCRFNDKPLVIGVDLRSNLVYLTIRKKTPINVELIEKVLNLT